MPDDAPSHSRSSDERRPILFVDFDDVIVLNAPYGGFDAKRELAAARKSSGEPDERPDLWGKLFDAKACAILADINRGFRPIYVLSTSWWWHFTKDELFEILTRCGLTFVCENLHEDWATRKALRPEARWSEIKRWIDAHPEYAERWVVVDDELSGTGLASDQPAERLPFIVLCAENIGLTVVEHEKLRVALSMRAGKTKKSGGSRETNAD